MRERIEIQPILAMLGEADVLSATDLCRIDDGELAKEVVRRSRIHDKWVVVYWKEFILFAHGVRLFGKFYNDAIRPEDPFSFTELLLNEDLLSVKRNLAIEELVAYARDRPDLVQRCESGSLDDSDGRPGHGGRLPGNCHRRLRRPDDGIRRTRPPGVDP